EFIELDPKKVEVATTDDELRDRWRRRLELEVMQRVSQMEARLAADKEKDAAGKDAAGKDAAKPGAGKGAVNLARGKGGAGGKAGASSGVSPHGLSPRGVAGPSNLGD